MSKKKDIQTIIKESAERYGLEYDKKQTKPSVLQKDGTVREINEKDFLKAFD